MILWIRCLLYIVWFCKQIYARDSWMLNDIFDDLNQRFAFSNRETCLKLLDHTWNGLIFQIYLLLLEVHLFFQSLIIAYFHVIFARLINKGLIRLAPAGRTADIFILKLARRNSCKFLTNDLFRNYYNEFGEEWIKENRITYMYEDGELIID